MRIRNRYWVFLEELRRSGKTNMYGAAPYLMKRFPELSHAEAKEVLRDWMDNYDPDDYAKEGGKHE